MISLKVIFVSFILGFSFFTQSNYCHAAKILGLFAFPGKSHFMTIRAIMTELARRGHEVTVISNFRIDEKLPNYKELVIDPPLDYWKDVITFLGRDDIYDVKYFSTRQIYNMMNRIGYATTEHFLKSSHMKNFITNDRNQIYDLLIVEQFFQDALLAFGHIYKLPVVAICTAGFENHMSTMIGAIVPWAHSPQDYLPYSDHMDFFERLWNTLCSLYSEYNRKFKYFPEQDELVRKYFSGIEENIPSVSELEKNVSVLLVNNFVPLDIPRPSTMSLISVGGAHITPPKTLPRDIRTFLDDARHGAIYFSFGTNYKSSDIPEDKLKAILKVFGRLKERVLWKWEEGAKMMPKFPSNVMPITRWIPQNDVLAHPHVKFFITHGGLLGLQEAVYRAVPILGIPIFGDQYVNVRKATDLGIGVLLDFNNITETSFTWALQQLIHEPSYAINMRKIAQIFRDRPLGAMETSIFWIEYVIRYKGAPHIKTAAVYLPWYKLYLIDIVIYLLLCSLFIIGTIYSVVYFIFFIRKRRQSAKLSSKLS